MSIVLKDLRKRFGHVVVVDGVSLQIEEGELLVLLGRSGSGKSTVLRMIAGLSRPDAGTILLKDRDVTHLPPQQRGTGFVFQNYSVFRHMTVGENVEFGLRIRGVKADKRRARREELLELVGLAGLGDREPRYLSGGQQQRVALARALAYEPEVLLLDEPFGALDVKTRAQLRRALREIQRSIGVTTVVVTHDQEEAFELADRIAVLEGGRLVEVAEPEELYRVPKTSFAAIFVGLGNVLVGRVAGGSAQVGPLKLAIPEDATHEEGASVQVLVRPEHVVLSENEPPPESGFTPLARGTIIDKRFTGSMRQLRVAVPRPPGAFQLAPLPPFGEERLVLDAVLPAEAQLPAEPFVSFRAWHVLEQARPRLLVVRGPKRDTPSTEWIAKLASALGAQATILSIVEESDAQDAARSAIAAEIEAAGSPRGIDVRVRVGDAGEQVAFETHEAFYDLLIVAPAVSAASPPKGMERRTRSRPHELGDLVESLLESPRVPILFAPTEPAEIADVLICTAAGQPGEADVRLGGWLARRLSASATLLHVERPDAKAGVATQAHLRRAAQALASMDVTARIASVAAPTPAGGILRECSSGAHGLVVIGHHGPRRRVVFAREDVAAQVLASSPIPVLVVPSREM